LLAVAKGQRTFENLCVRAYFCLPPYAQHCHNLLPGAQISCSELVQRDTQDVLSYISSRNTVLGASSGSVQQLYRGDPHVRSAPPSSNLDVAQRLIRSGLVHQPAFFPNHSGGYAPAAAPTAPMHPGQYDRPPAAGYSRSAHPAHGPFSHNPPYDTPPAFFGYPSASHSDIPAYPRGIPPYGSASSYEYGDANGFGGGYAAVRDMPPRGAVSHGYGAHEGFVSHYAAAHYQSASQAAGRKPPASYLPHSSDPRRPGYLPSHLAAPLVDEPGAGYGYGAAPMHPSDRTAHYRTNPEQPALASLRTHHFDSHMNSHPASEANRAAAAAFRNQQSR
jgi:hypothetical protein